MSPTHDPAELVDVSDGNQVVAGVAPPTATERVAAIRSTPDELQAAIDAHVAEVNIHDRRNS